MNNEQQVKKLIIAHPGKQHSLQLAKSLKNLPYFHKYFTTVYYNPNKFIYKIMNKFLGDSNKKRMVSRKDEELKLEEIKQYFEISGLFLLLLRRIDKKNFIYSKYEELLQGFFSLRVAKYSKKNDIKYIIMYETSAFRGFKYLKNTNKVKILDMAGISAEYIKSIYEADKKKCGEFSVTYKSKYLFDEELIRRRKQEIMMADYFIVPSHFAKKTLLSQGIVNSQIFVLPLGVDSTKFSIKKYSNDYKKTINFLFVGRLEQAKGIYYLLEAIKQLDNKKIHFTLVGEMFGEHQLFSKYKKYFTHIPHVPSAEIIDIYQNADVFVFPSMWDSFGLVILEAMSTGLPVISTSNTAAPDLIEDGVQGFIIPPGDIEAIKHKITYFIENPSKIQEMGKKARKKAEEYDWENYDYKSKKILNEIVIKEL